MAPIRSLMVFDTAIDADAFARSCRDWGVDTPCLHPGFLEDRFYVQAEPLYRARTITVEQFDAELTHARKGDPAAIVVFQYEELAARPEKADVLLKHFRS